MSATLNTGTLSLRDVIELRLSADSIFSRFFVCFNYLSFRSFPPVSSAELWEKKPIAKYSVTKTVEVSNTKNALPQ
jgi:hypothetical protein